ncbi:AAA family ATPase [Devosia sp.]|uniref:AAA family ATPase n=1 Tax=Devosia sp. TaxID=1871048 RepID=UPI001AC8286F|nr:AAA family ATPase [Devosia sp.]MBN9336085.1 AAA family ATPase [Devosia sp.]
MKFTAIEIENMFAYEGRCVIDLSGTDEHRNIVLVKGRNGAGKTSLLNAVKLLFLGSRDEGLRRVGFGSTSLSEKHYVLGQPGRWYGVFNSTARRKHVTEASIALRWLEGGQAYVAKRSFVGLRHFTMFAETAEFGKEGSLVKGDEAEFALQQLLPREVVPFFFFDAEHIQSLADAEIGRERSEIERLLGLSFIAHLMQQTDEYVKARNRAGLSAENQLKLVAAENAARQARANEEASARTRVDAEEDLMDLERRRFLLDEERTRLRGGALSESEGRRINGRLENLAAERQVLADELAERLPAEIVFRTQPRLVSDAFTMLDQQAMADISLAGKLHRELPNQTVIILESVEPPVVLTQVQRESVEDGVRSALRTLGVSVSPSHAVLSSLSSRKAKALRDVFLLYAERGRVDFSHDRGMLRRMRELVSETQRLQRELDEAELTSDESRGRYERLTEELLQVNESIKDAARRSAQAEAAEERHRKEALEYDRAVEQAMERAKETSKNDAKYQLGLRTKRALDSYLQGRRAQIRASVERRLREKVGILLGPTRLIKSIDLNDQFVMTYLDEQGEEVARHSVSAGMRQLLAMAMLWALNEEVGRSLPVIVDTPLGRIDQENRDMLLVEYFPNAGNPLVLLPTNTEFTDHAQDLIGDRIAHTYQIDNQDGTNAVVGEVR